MHTVLPQQDLSRLRQVAGLLAYPLTLQPESRDYHFMRKVIKNMQDIPPSHRGYITCWQNR